MCFFVPIYVPGMLIETYMEAKNILFPIISQLLNVILICNRYSINIYRETRHLLKKKQVPALKQFNLQIRSVFLSKTMILYKVGTTVKV